MENEFWIIKIVVATLLLTAINYTLKYSLKFLRRRLIAKHSSWKANLDQIVFLPLHSTLWIIGIAYVFEILGYRFNLWINPVALTNFRNASIIACLAWILLKWKQEIEKTLIDHAIDTQTVYIIGKIGSLIILILSGMIILQILGLDIVPLIAFGGIGAAAVGFAAKDVIANFCGGLMLYLTRPFTVGDWVVMPDRGIEGIIEQIGWYLTTVRDREKRPNYIPNSIFSQQLVVNSSRMSHRRIFEKIGVRYQDFEQVKPLVAALRAVIASHPRIDTHLPLHINFNGFTSCSLEIQIDVFTLATRYEEYLAVKQELLLSVYETLLAHGAEMPYPTTTLHYPK
jgi:MscS family membrane protein